MKIKKFNDLNKMNENSFDDFTNQEVKIEILSYIQRIHNKVFDINNPQILDFLKNDLSEITKRYKI